MITDEDVAEFQELYAEKFGTPIDKDGAYEKLTVLVRQMEIIYQPIRRLINEHGDENGRTIPSDQHN